MAKSMRATLEEAFDQHAGEETGSTDPVGDEPSPEEGSTTGEPTGEPVGQTDDTPPEQAAESSETEKSGPKFLPAEEDQGEGEKSAERPATIERAPAGWKGAAKEKWTELPEPVQQEILRREREMGSVTREAAAAKGFEQQFSQVVAPFMGFIEADQSTPLQAVQNLMQTAAVFRVGTPQQKAATAADIIKRFGVDINMLDSMLVGQQPSPADAQTNQLFQYLDQRLAPVEAMAGMFQNARQSAAQRQDQELEQELKDLIESGEAEYLEDVRQDMADLLEMADRRREKMTYKQAYERAILMRPELASAVAQKRAAAERQAQVAAQQASLERKKRASASVQGTPPGSNGATPPTNRREALLQAWDAAESGGV